MNTQEHFDAVIKQARNKTFSESPQITLGEIIEQLEGCELKNSKDEFKSVEFDFVGAVPTNLDSWRGSYDELALGFKLSGYDNNDEHFANTDVDSLLKELKSAFEGDKTYCGWKGGDYIMTEKTPVWVANSGNAGNTAIIGVVDDGWRILLMTAYCEF